MAKKIKRRGTLDGRTVTLDNVPLKTGDTALRTKAGVTAIDRDGEETTLTFKTAKLAKAFFDNCAYADVPSHVEDLAGIEYHGGF